MRPQPKPPAQGLARITCWAPCAPRWGSPSRLPPISQVQLNRIIKWSEQEEGINETGTLGAASLQRACVGKIASWPCLLNEAANNVPVAFYPVMRSETLVIHPPFLVFMKIKSGGEVFGQKYCHLLVRGRNMKLLLVCGNVSFTSSKKPTSHLPCLFFLSTLPWVKNQKTDYFGTSLRRYFNSELMVTICRIKVHINILLRGQE